MHLFKGLFREEDLTSESYKNKHTLETHQRKTKNMKDSNLKSSMIFFSEINNYDYCIVFPSVKIHGEWNLTEKGIEYLGKLQDLGFETFTFRVLGQKPLSISSIFHPLKKHPFDQYCLIYVLLRVSLERLREHAERIDLRMLIDPLQTEDLLSKGDSEAGIAPITIRHEPDITPLLPCQYIYGPYHHKFESLFWKPAALQAQNEQDQSLLNRDHDHPFRDLLRIKITAVILQSRPRYYNEETKEKYSKENLKIARYLRKNWLLGCFLLHKSDKSIFFRKQWSNYPREVQPLEEIKEYFGEKVALYHCFMDHFTKFLVIPSLIAIPFQIVIFLTNNYNSKLAPFYAWLLPMWSIFMLEVSLFR
jgi:hypothetical protein